MVNTKKHGSKVSRIKFLLTNKPLMSMKEIAEDVNCDISLVYQTRKRTMAKVKKTETKKPNIKVKHITQGKSRGKEVLAVDIMSDMELLTGACKVIDALVKATKDLCFAFDHQKQAIEILWHEELYDVSIAEVPQTIEAIRFLQSKEKNYRNLPMDYDDSIPF